MDMTDEEQEKFQDEDEKRMIYDNKLLATHTDPNAPRRACSAFHFFSKEFNEAHKENEMAIGVRNRLISAAWKDVSTKERDRFQGIAVGDRERFDKETEAYETSGRPQLFLEKLRKSDEKAKKHVAFAKSVKDAPAIASTAPSKKLHRKPLVSVGSTATDKTRKMNAPVLDDPSAASKKTSKLCLKRKRSQTTSNVDEVPISPSAYHYFLLDHPLPDSEDVSFQQRNKRVAQSWCALPKEQKDKYQQMADEETARCKPSIVGTSGRSKKQETKGHSSKSTTSSVSVADSKTRKKWDFGKDPNAPKPAVTPFTFFCREQIAMRSRPSGSATAQVDEGTPIGSCADTTTAPTTDRASECDATSPPSATDETHVESCASGMTAPEKHKAMWKELGVEERARFCELAKADKVRYEDEANAYAQSEQRAKYTQRLEDEAAMEALPPRVLRKILKDPNAPRRAGSSFLFFCDEFNHSAEMQFEPKKSMCEQQQAASAAWKSLPEEDKARFTELAAADKLRYQKEKAAYELSEEYTNFQAQVRDRVAEARIGPKAVKRFSKDPNTPKLPRNAYAFYLDQNTVSDTATPSRQLWDEMTCEDKALFEDLALRDKARYQEECEAYEHSEAKMTFELDRRRRILEASRKLSSVSIQKPVEKDVNAPKRAKTPFLLFSQSILASNADVKQLPFAQRSRRMGQMWKEASTEERASFEAQSKEDSLRYQEEVKEYANSDGKKEYDEKALASRSLMSNVRTKDPNAPKRPAVAFLFFMKATLSANPDIKALPISERSGRIGTLWAALSDEDKLPFQAQATEDAIRYKNEQQAYMQSDGKKAFDAQQAQQNHDIQKQPFTTSKTPKQKDAFFFFSKEYTASHPETKEMRSPVRALHLRTVWSEMGESERSVFEGLSTRGKVNTACHTQNPGKKTEGKRVKDPNAPKNPRTAFLLFSQAYCKEHDDIKNVPFSERGKQIASVWKQMTAETRQPFFDMATADKERYDRESEVYKTSGAQAKFVSEGGKIAKEKPVIGKKARKARGAVVPLRTAFAFFAQEFRAKHAGTVLGSADVVVEWANLSSEQQTRYFEMEINDQERFNLEMETESSRAVNAQNIWENMKKTCMDRAMSIAGQNTETPKAVAQRKPKAVMRSGPTKKTKSGTSAKSDEAEKKSANACKSKKKKADQKDAKSKRSKKSSPPPKATIKKKSHKAPKKKGKSKDKKKSQSNSETESEESKKASPVIDTTGFVKRKRAK